MTRLAVVLVLWTLLTGGGAGRAGDGRAGDGRAGDSRASHGRTAVGAEPPPGEYSAPVAALRVLRRFQPPPTPYSAGHRGVDLATAASAAVRAPAAGRVSFAGRVAARGVVVIVHPDGISTEYEPVTPSVRTGAAVVRGQPIGTVHGIHGPFPADRCLHWGARRDGAYFDPLALLRPLGPVRLLPWNGQGY